MEAIIKMFMDFIVKLMSLIGEDVPGFVVDWMDKVGAEEETTTEPTA